MTTRAHSRRTFLRTAAAATTLPWVSALGCGPDEDTTPRNVVFLMSDDQRWDTVGYLGNPIIETPGLDRLARAGTVFANNFVTTSICPTSRTSVFTGQYARHHGVVDFGTPLSDAQRTETYPARLRAAGFFTGFIGKYGLGGPLPADDFDVFQGYEGQGTYFPDDSGVHLTTMHGDLAIAFLTRRAAEQRPFCLSVSFKAPHAQSEAPYLANDPALDPLYAGQTIPRPDKSDPRFFAALPPFLRDGYRGRSEYESYFSTPDLYQDSVRRYYRLISGVDAQVVRLLDALDELGLASSTAVVYTSDNGWFLGERGLGGKWLMHEESIRTPMLVYDPLAPRSHGRVVTEMSLNIDVCATVCGLAGVAPPQGTDGRDLRPLMRGDASSWREDWFYEHLFVHPEIPVSEGVRTTRWKYITYPGRDAAYDELYDLEHDPLEHENLVSRGEHAATLADLRARHQAYVASL